MDWIKVPNKYTLHEYADLSDSQFRAWIEIMALTASMEHIPNDIQIQKNINFRAVNFLKESLRKRGGDLEETLRKVLEDVEEVKRKRQDSKNKMRQWRDLKQNVTGNVTSKRREEKRREEYIIEEEKSATPTPSQIATQFFNENKDSHDPEIKKFVEYWTELTKSGKKQKWELQKTFEVNKRLTTWRNNSFGYKKEEPRIETFTQRPPEEKVMFGDFTSSQLELADTMIEKYPHEFQKNYHCTIEEFQSKEEYKKYKRWLNEAK